MLVVTPLMKRNQRLPCSSEIIFIDSTSSCESTYSSITPILSATPGGAVPIAVLIHKSQTTICYEKGFRLLKKHFPRCFGGQTVNTTNLKLLKLFKLFFFSIYKQFFCLKFVGTSSFYDRRLKNRKGCLIKCLA